MLRVAPYSQLAAAYDQALGLQSFALAKRGFEWVARRYGLRFSSAADVGCGTGLFACYLARCWKTSVFGVDRSREMLTIAACRCRNRNIHFLRQDIRRLQLPCPV